MNNGMLNLDLTCFGFWNGDGFPLCSQNPAGADELLLEIKSAEMASSEADLREVLNALTGELKAQFVTFQRLRLSAEKVLDEAGEDEAQAKLAKADLKASSDAIGQIVRTLEKVDNLQRSLADARHAEGEDELSDVDIDTLRDDVLALIEERAEELYRERLETRGGELGVLEPPG